LFGTFNGVNVGCEDDSDNVSHKFVDGKLTMTFTADSYVAVKTTDNVNWFMFNEYTTATSGTLYNTATGAAEKMKVPAGTVTFTLTDGAAAGSLLLSYVVVSEPTTAATQATTKATEATQATTTPKVEGDITLRFAVPEGTYTAYKWNAPVFYYTNTAPNSFADVTKLAMTKTDDVFYGAETGQATLITPGAWQIYEITLTPEQQEFLNKCTRVGFASSTAGTCRTTITSNVLKAATNGYAAYSSTAADVATFDGATFIITDAAYGATSATSYVGYWGTGLTTVRATGVLSGLAYSNWLSTDMFYGSTTAIDSMTNLKMVSTGERTKVEDIGIIETAIAGRWLVFARTLNANEVAAVEAAKYVGFRKTDNANRTLVTNNVLKAPIDYYTGSYNKTKATLASLEDKIFVISNCTYTNRSVHSYVGAWETEAVYSQGKDDTITINFAAPTSSNAYYQWAGNDLELYYASVGGGYKTTNRIALTPTDKTYTMEAEKIEGLEYVTAGEWQIYTAELTPAQMSAIQESIYMGFIKKDSFVRTKYTTSKNLLRASKEEYTPAYGSITAIDSLDGYTFVIQGKTSDGFEADSYMGSWVAADAIG
jgi:hypothetical protein